MLPLLTCPGVPAALLLLAHTGPAVLPDSLTRAERQVVQQVDRLNAEGLALLERVVNINSGTMNLEGVRAVGRIFRAQFDSLGFATRWVDGSGFARAGHLVADHPGPGPRLLLIGHLDTVFEPSSPFQRMEPRDSGMATGPGIIDMKGGDVIIVQAMKALRAAGLLDRLNLVVVMTGDEEHPGEPLDSARAALVAAARTARVAIGFEDGDGDPHTAVIARRGASSWVLTSTGIPAHSSQIFRSDIGAGAIYEAARVLDQFRQRLGTEQYLTFNPGVAVGGTAATFDEPQARGTAFGKSNVVADTMTVLGDLRALSADQLAHARAVMREVVGQPLPHTTSQIRFEDGYPPLAPTDGNRRLLTRYDQVSRDLGFGPVRATDPGAAGAADVSFTAPYVEMAIDGLGLAGHDDHSPAETADLRTLPMLTKRAAILLLRLAAR